MDCQQKDKSAFQYTFRYVTHIDIFLETQSRARSNSTQMMNVNFKHSSNIEYTHEGKIVPLAPPSGISLFFKDWVDANP